MGLALRCMAVGLLLAAAPAGAVSFTRIAGGSADVRYLAPAVDDGLVAFRAFDIDTGVFGIYSISGGTQTTVADSSTAVPGRSGTFSSFGMPGVSDGNIAFAAESEDAGGSLTSFGIYASFGGAPVTEVVGASYPPTAGALLPVDNFRSAAIEGTRVAFAGNVFDGVSVGPRAIYASGPGGLELIADSATTLPDGNTPIFSSTPVVSIDSTGVAFWAEDYDDYPDGRHEGIYVADGGAILRTVVDTSMLAPHTGDPFVDLRLADSHDGNTVFGGTTLTSATTVSPFALYAEIGGVLIWIADAPAGQFFDAASIHGDRIAWYTTASCPSANDCPQAINAYVDGQRVTVISAGDALDGRVVDWLSLGSDAISGDQLVFAAHFTDGASGVYAADLSTIPEPGTALLLAAGLVALGAARRRSGA